jgi:hypothetical protein
MMNVFYISHLQDLIKNILSVNNMTFLNLDTMHRFACLSVLISPDFHPNNLLMNNMGGRHFILRLNLQMYKEKERKTEKPNLSLSFWI